MPMDFDIRVSQGPSVEGGYQAAGNAAAQAEIQKGAWARALREGVGAYNQRAHARDLMEFQAERADRRDVMARDYDRSRRAEDFERRKDLSRFDYDLRSQLQDREYADRVKLERLKEAQKRRGEADYAMASGIVSAMFDEARASKASDPFQRVDRPLADLHPQFMGKSDQELLQWFADRNPGQDPEWAKQQVQAIKRPGGAMYLAPGLLDKVKQRVMGVTAQQGVNSEVAAKALSDYLESYGDMAFGYKAAAQQMAERYDKSLGAHFRPESPRDAKEANALGLLFDQLNSTKQNVPGIPQPTGAQVTPKPGYSEDGQLMVPPPPEVSAGIVDAPQDLTNPKATPDDIITSVYGEATPLKLQPSLLSELGLSTTQLFPTQHSAEAQSVLSRLGDRDVSLVPVMDGDGKITGLRIEGDVSDIRRDNPEALREMERSLNSYDALVTAAGLMYRRGGTREEQKRTGRNLVRHTPEVERSASEGPTNPDVPRRNFIGEAFQEFQ